ncbi:hypothetical protein AAU61_16240 [Desulfocarbo indianensis]|nr:hypothetical protein AAU61_16240 [Desulfocarbo indianensis]
MGGHAWRKRLASDLAEPALALQTALEILAELRPMDPEGAALVLERHPQVRRLLAQGPPAAERLAGRLEELAQAAACLGCGTCCRSSSPTLYQEDLELISPAGLPRSSLFALRPGQRVSSARQGGSYLLEGELIKLREHPAGAPSGERGCLFLEKGRCAVYQSRPLQCRTLECWSGRHAGQLAGSPRLSRARLFAGDDTALALIEEYDLKIPAARLTGCLEEAAQGEAGAQARALSLLELDHKLRAGARERFGYAPEELDLMWGLPAVALARAHGLEPALDRAGRPTLRKNRA